MYPKAAANPVHDLFYRQQQQVCNAATLHLDLQDASHVVPSCMGLLLVGIFSYNPQPLQAGCDARQSHIIDDTVTFSKISHLYHHDVAIGSLCRMHVR